MLDFIQSNPVLFAVLLVVLVVVAVFVAVPFAIKKGWNPTPLLGKTSTALGTADIVVDGLRGMFPNNPQLQLLDRIVTWSQKGVEYAEQLYKIGEIEAEKRKEEAQAFIYKMLNEAGIEATDQIESIVDGCLEAAVAVLSPTGIKRE